jgi:hypothetical protein
MKRLALILLISCGSPHDEPAQMLTASGTGAVSPTYADGGWVDPCTLVNDRDHRDVVNTVLEIDNTDPRCMPPRYETQGQVTIDALPISDNKLGPCPITYTQTMRVAFDGGTEPACRTTASCLLQFNGGDTQLSYDLLWDVYGTFRGTQESVSTGQLCPYVKLYSNNTGLP